MTGVVPIAELERRIPVGGRIRIGEQRTSKRGKSYPAKLDTFRLTSHDRAAIEQVADVYGGQPRQWQGAPGAGDQWEVVTESAELRVWLPPGDPLHQAYELWSGGGCQRRCDGVIVQVTEQTSPDGSEVVERPCLCEREGSLACSLTTRLSVLLPDVRFAGAWRLDSKGSNAAAELGGMVDTIRVMQAQAGGGTPVATLALEQRTSGNRHFVVPVLRPDGTPEELVRGELTAGHRLGTTTGAPALPPAGREDDRGRTTPVAALDAQTDAQDVVDAHVIPDAEDLHARLTAWVDGDDGRKDAAREWLAGRGVDRVSRLDGDGLDALADQLDEWEVAS